MDLTIPIITAAASLYGIVWILTARHLFLTHQERTYRWLERSFRVQLAAKYLALALVWPLFLLYLAVTVGARNKEA